MIPRLAVTKEQAAEIEKVFGPFRVWRPLTLPFPERPTMPCSREHIQHGKVWSEVGAVPIPEGTRVEVGYPCECSEHRPGMHINTAKCPHNRTGGVIPVAYATLTEVRWTYTTPTPTTPAVHRWRVTLTDLRPIDG